MHKHAVAAMPILASSILALSLSLAMPRDTRAATINKGYFSHAVSLCQPALPAFDGLIRKRPKAVANEGNSNAFVTCAPNGHGNNRVVGAIQIIFGNRSGVPVTIACTVVDGVHDDVYSESITKTVTLFTNGSDVLAWSIADNGGAHFKAPAVSCKLPPGTEISQFAFTALDEIGS